MKHFFVAGFDFGTSYSKVVIQDQNTRIQKVVTFGDAFGALFPSCVYVGKEWISGPEVAYDGILVSYPKLVAADAASGSSVFQSVTSGSCREAQDLLGIEDPKQFAKLILTRYFLSVLNGIHAFISGDDDWHSFDPYTDPFVVQLAVPTGLMDKADRKTEILMRECLMAATRVRDALSATESWSSIHDLTDALAGVGSLSTEERRALEERCITYPEVAAGVQPILQSGSVRDGKYITLDVGAGTVDLNAFHRWTRDTDHKSLDYWACQVKPLGFARLAVAGSRVGRSNHEITVNPMSEADLIRKLKHTIRELMGQAFIYQPYASVGNGPSPWAGETYAYIWGGGAQHPAFEACLLKVLQDFNIGIHVINRLPSPNKDLHLPPGVAFGRLAIAFGLSYYHPNLKEIRLPSNLKSYAEQYGIGAVEPTVGEREIDDSSRRNCPCQGNNQACSRCDGKGYYEVGRAPLPKVGPIPPVVRSPTHENRQPKKSKPPSEHQEVEAVRRLMEDFKERGQKVSLTRRISALNKILILSKRPVVRSHKQCRQEVEQFLAGSFDGHSGDVFLRKSAMELETDGCWVLAENKPGLFDRFFVTHPTPEQFYGPINKATGQNLFEIQCSIHRNPELGLFSLSPVNPDDRPKELDVIKTKRKGRGADGGHRRRYD